MNKISIQWALAIACLISAAIMVACRQGQPAGQEPVSQDKTLRHADIDSFFKDYEQRFNQGLSGQAGVSDAVATFFEDCVVESSPAGIICGQNDQAFPGRIRQGFEFYKHIGTKSMEILSKDVTVLDALHRMVKVRWHYTAVKKEGSPVKIDFDVIYLLRVNAGKVKIFAFITGDEQKVLQEHGLVQ